MKEEGRGEKDVDGDREMEEEGRRKQGERGREEGRGGRERVSCAPDSSCCHVLWDESLK